MRACTSPGRSRRSTPSSALTPGNSMEIPVISTTGRTSSGTSPRALPAGPASDCVIVDLPWSAVGAVRDPHRTHRGTRWSGSVRQYRWSVPGSVLPVRQGGLGGLLVERLVLGDDALVDGLARHDLLR